ncbi:hypothetical protein B5F27_12745 [Faecalibacterium sp. An192]|nr:ATP-binding protein [Faecalibacterium sp. An192]OUP26643.1 hypothetical protein B5F27_12745 [Faecalibacterium sp. An192]
MDLHRISSMRRNQIISDVFLQLNFMERRGSGIDRILNSYAEVAQKLVFYSDSDIFLVTLPNRSVANPAQISLDDVATAAQDLVNASESLATSGQSLATFPEDLVTAQTRMPKGIEQGTEIMWWNCSGAMVTDIRSIPAMRPTFLVLNRLPLQRHHRSSVNWK